MLRTPIHTRSPVREIAVQVAYNLHQKDRGQYMHILGQHNEQQYPR
jgi:hypothetical protein